MDMFKNEHARSVSCLGRILGPNPAYFQLPWIPKWEPEFNTSVQNWDRKRTAIPDFGADLGLEMDSKCATN